MTTLEYRGFVLYPSRDSKYRWILPHFANEKKNKKFKSFEQAKSWIDKHIRGLV